MNERIKELRKRVSADIDPQSQREQVAQLMAFFADNETNKIFSEYLEKYSELLVSEVLAEAAKFNRQNPGHWDEYALVTTVLPMFVDITEPNFDTGEQ